MPIAYRIINMHHIHTSLTSSGWKWQTPKKMATFFGLSLYNPHGLARPICAALLCLSKTNKWAFLLRNLSCQYLQRWFFYLSPNKLFIRNSLIKQVNLNKTNGQCSFWEWSMNSFSIIWSCRVLQQLISQHLSTKESSHLTKVNIARMKLWSLQTC